MVQKLFNLDKGLHKVEHRRFKAQYYDKQSEDYYPDSFLSGSAADIEDHFIPPNVVRHRARAYPTNFEAARNKALRFLRNVQGLPCNSTTVTLAEYNLNHYPVTPNHEGLQERTLNILRDAL